MRPLNFQKYSNLLDIRGAQHFETLTFTGFDILGLQTASALDVTTPTDKLISSTPLFLNGVDIEGSTTTTTTLAVGAATIQSDLGFQDDQDYIKVNLVAGNTYIFDLDLAQTGDWYGFNLLSISGRQQINSSHYVDGDYTTVRYTAPETGTYHLVIEEYSGGNGGTFVATDYSVSFSEVEEDHGDSVATATALTIGTPVAGEIGFEGDFDFFIFSIDSAAAIDFSVGGAAVEMRVFEVSFGGNLGLELTSFIDGNADFQLAISSPGQYVVVIDTAQQGSTLASYTLSLTESPDDFAGDATTSGSVTVGGPAIAGEIQSGIDQDWFAVTLTSGTTVEASLSFDSNISNFFVVQYYDANGELVSDSSVIQTTVAGQYYVSVGSPFGSTTGAYDLSLATIEDDYLASTSTTGTLIIDGGPTSIISQFQGDDDWLAVTVDAGDKVLFAATIDGRQFSDVDLELFDAQGNSVALGITDSNVDRATLYYEFDTGGTYYISSSLNTSFELGLQITAETVNDPDGPVALTDDGTVINAGIDYVGDQDAYTLTLDVDDYVRITFDQSNGLDGGRITVTDPNGQAVNLQTFQFGNEFFLDAIVTGDYQINVRSVIGIDEGDYAISAVQLPPPSPLDAITWGTALPGAGNGTLTINVFFQTAQTDFVTIDGVALTAETWNAYEMQQVMIALAMFESFIDVDFQVVTNAAQADLTLAVGSDPDLAGTLGLFYPPEEGENAGLGLFNRAGLGWDEDGAGGLEVGGYGYLTFIHELAHGLGLAHPHDEGGTSSVLSGVGLNQQSIGDFGLNQTAYTIMSYVDTFTGATGQFPGSTRGNVGTLSPFDIAVLQSIYGSVDGNIGDTVYSLSELSSVREQFASIWDTGGVDTLIAGSDADAILNLNAATLRYRDGGGGVVSNLIGSYAGYTIAAGVEIENATGGNGNDLITGNALNNVLIGNGGDDSLLGMGGDDILEAGDGFDSLNGGTGNDMLIAGQSTTAVEGGLGTDTVNFAAVLQGMTIDLGVGNAFATGDMFGNMAWLTNIEIYEGSNFADTFVGRDYLDDDGYTLSGLGGDDMFILGLGSDIVDGGEGSDTIDYSDADSSIRVVLSSGIGSLGEANGDTYSNVENVIGTAFTDYLTGSIGANTLTGNGGDDYFYIDEQDTIDGGAGRDRVYAVNTSGALNIDLAASSIEVIHGANQADVLDGSASTVALVLYGNGRNDILSGGSAADYINGGAGDDTLNGGAGNDILDGLTNADTINGGDGNDIIFVDHLDTLTGGAGYDRIFVRGYSDGMNVDLGAAGIEYANGNTKDDVFDASGSTVSVKLLGQGGDDTLIGGFAADQLYGSLGNDTLSGGDGADILNAGSGADSLSGGDGNDIIFVDNLDTFVDGGAGSDRVYANGGSGALTLDLGASDVEFASGSEAGDTFTAATLGEAAKILGQGGNDSIIGSAFNDLIYGQGGNDTISGGEGFDGNDFLSGGAGTDIFVFGEEFGNDLVTDFDTNGETLDFTALGITLADLSINAVGNHTIINYGTNSIFLIGVDAATLDASDFIF